MRSIDCSSCTSVTFPRSRREISCCKEGARGRCSGVSRHSRRAPVPTISESIDLSQRRSPLSVAATGPQRQHRPMVLGPPSRSVARLVLLADASTSLAARSRTGAAQFGNDTLAPAPRHCRGRASRSLRRGYAPVQVPPDASASKFLVCRSSLRRSMTSKFR